ncbi:toprim domain-containing protein [Novosphingobium sp. 9U]|uniref:DUF7146 domain-containing protein n=1 Tax=Novosphingobium sp. 9U TaxID=2653158 RepID=UPI0012F0F14F|nr:toprim domain-containing protein [Novosphingobium sp. 9U]VWX51037.1 Virulence-associated protein E [Novosphingobium sp. 9U]
MSITTNRPSQRLIDLVGALGGKWHGYSAMCRCPVHQDQTPSLSLRQGDRGILVHCFAGCDSQTILRELDGIKPDQSYEFRERPAPLRAANLDRIWEAGVPIAGTLGEKYLIGRWIPANCPEVRYHPLCPKGRSPHAVFKPAVLVAVREGRALRALQRIFLDPTTARYTEKLMLGNPGAAAWQGSVPTDTLAIAEGFEDAACYMRITGVPAWAALGNSRLHLLAIPKQVQTIIIAQDNDPEGDRTAGRAAQVYRDQGFRVWRHSPHPHEDWAAVPMEV